MKEITRVAENQTDLGSNEQSFNPMFFNPSNMCSYFIKKLLTTRGNAYEVLSLEMGGDAMTDHY